MKLRIGIVGAGPSGLAQLRAFKSAEKKEKKYRKLFVLKNRKIGAGCGIIRGELA